MTGMSGFTKKMRNKGNLANKITESDAGNSARNLNFSESSFNYKEKLGGMLAKNFDDWKSESTYK